MKRKSRFFPGVGASSILMIFVVLCLTTFGVLSYVTANADRKISTKNAESVENYYKAYTQVQSKLQQIDSALLTAQTKIDTSVYNNTASAAQEKQTGGIMIRAPLPNKNYFTFAKTELSAINAVTVTETEENKLQVSFSEQVDTNRNISVILTVNPYGEAQRYQITQQKLVTNSPAESSDTLTLWQGSSTQ